MVILIKLKIKLITPKKRFIIMKKALHHGMVLKFHGKLTANGEIFNQYQMTAAHKTLPLPSVVQVINLKIIYL